MTKETQPPVPPAKALAETADDIGGAGVMDAAFFDTVMKRRVARTIEDLDDDTLRTMARIRATSSHRGGRALA